MHHRVHPVVIGRVVGRERVVPDHFPGARPDRDHGAGVQVVAGATEHAPWSRVPGPPVHEVELGIVRAGDPGRSAAVFPRVVARPGFGPLLAGRRNDVVPPQLLTGLRVPAVEVAARTELRPGDAGDYDAVRHERRDRHRIALLVVVGPGLPQLLAGLRVEREDMRVERRTDELALVDRRAAAHLAAADVARDVRLVFDVVSPQPLAGDRIDRERAARGGHVHHAVVHQRLRLVAEHVRRAVAPYRDEALDRAAIHLRERAVTLLAVPHAVRQHVARRAVVVSEIVAALRVDGGNQAQAGRERTRRDWDAKHVLLLGIVGRRLAGFPDRRGAGEVYGAPALARQRARGFAARPPDVASLSA